MSIVLILGSGAREHAIVDTLIRTSCISKIYISPGNDAISINNNIVETCDIHNKHQIVEFCKKNYIDMVIIGPEKPLVDGFVNYLNSYNIPCFGPHKEAALIEGSKVFSKNFMSNNHILTANYHIFDNYNDAILFISTIDISNYVIKEDGLALGKGVYLPENMNQARQILEDIFLPHNTTQIIIEQRLNGEEISLLGFCNGTDIELMPQSQDYKRFGDNDTGNNTGGMGAYAPANILTHLEILDIKQDMIKVVKNLNYKGVLYAGLMKTNNGIYFLEFNCRFGDPEAQVLLTLLDSDLYTIFSNCINGKNLSIKWKNGFASNVVLSHLDYPLSKSKTNLEIEFTKSLDPSIKLFWGNVKIIDGIYYTNGGRVVSVVCHKSTLFDSIHTIYNNIYKIQYSDLYFRKDIGLKELIKIKRIVED